VLGQALGALSHDLAVDLGTCNTLVYVCGRGVVLDEPSVVAIQRSGGSSRVVAVGQEAKQMVGRTPENITAVHPLQDGVIADFDMAEALIRTCIERALGSKPLVKPTIAVCVPHRLEDVERRAIKDSAKSAGAREVHLVGKPIAAAVGCGMPISEPVGNIVMDIGGGTTEVGLVSLGGIVVTRSTQIGGNHFDRAIAEWIKSKHNVLVGARTSELIKIEIGCASPSEQARTKSIKGRDMSTGTAREIVLSSDDIADALAEPLAQIVEVLRDTLRESPPELASDIVDRGLVLCGGSSLLSGIDRYIRDQSGLPVVVAEDPRRAAAMGAGRLLEDAETLARVAL
jgi:rod shape-determining protein MreB and related proteins